MADRTFGVVQGLSLAHRPAAGRQRLTVRFNIDIHGSDVFCRCRSAEAETFR